MLCQMTVVHECDDISLECNELSPDVVEDFVNECQMNEIQNSYLGVNGTF